jgi:hypothetical protein
MKMPLRFLSVALVSATASLAADPAWKHLSTEKGDLPLPWQAVEQTAAVVHDFDRDGKNDFVIGSRKIAPAVVWYRRTATGWDRVVIEPEMLRVEAGGAVGDIDGDGDPDLVLGGDASSNEVWWWENPHPRYDPNTPWQRRLIKQGGGNAHHDQAFADFKGTGRPQLAFWNQRVQKLFLADVPSSPRESGPWPHVEIFDAAKLATANKPEGMDVCDVDGDGRPDLLAGMHWFKHIRGNEFKAIQVSDRPGRIAGGKFKPGKLAQIVVAPGDLNGPIRFFECTGNPENPADWRGRDLLDREMIHGHSLALADIDGDGNLDIFAAEMAKWGRSEQPENPKATAWIWYGDGTGEFRRTVFQQGYGFHEARIADLNDDGRMDVLSKPYTWKAPRIDVWLQQASPARR